MSGVIQVPPPAGPQRLARSRRITARERGVERAPRSGRCRIVFARLRGTCRSRGPSAPRADRASATGSAGPRSTTGRSPTRRRAAAARARIAAHREQSGRIALLRMRERELAPESEDGHRRDSNRSHLRAEPVEVRRMGVTTTSSGRRILVIGGSSGVGPRGRPRREPRGRARGVRGAARASCSTPRPPRPGNGAIAVRCDVTARPTARARSDETAAAFGGIDALVYATGMSPLVMLEQASAEGVAPGARRQRDRRFADHRRGAAAPARECEGRAVYVSSYAVRQSLPGLGLYRVSEGRARRADRVLAHGASRTSTSRASSVGNTWRHRVRERVGAARRSPSAMKVWVSRNLFPAATMMSLSVLARGDPVGDRGARLRRRHRDHAAAPAIRSRGTCEMARAPAQFAALGACFALSGFAALVYQTRVDASSRSCSAPPSSRSRWCSRRTWRGSRQVARRRALGAATSPGARLRPARAQASRRRRSRSRPRHSPRRAADARAVRRPRRAAWRARRSRRRCSAFPARS